MRTFLLILFLASATRISIAQPISPDLNVSNALDEARSLTRQGKYEEALQKHILFHNHVLEKYPANRGVRLSFALSHWVELGAKYPRALTALKEIRDQNTKRLLNSQTNISLFQDVSAINRTLNESNATADLFKKIEPLSPQFAAQTYKLAEPALVSAGEFTLARKYLGDPMKRLEAASENFNRGKNRVSLNPQLALSAYESIFTDEVTRIITILKNTNENDLARKAQSEALKTLDSPEIRKAISND